MKKKIVGILICFSSTVSIAQVLKDKELIFCAGPTSTKINNKNIKSDKYKTIDNKNGFNVSFSFNKYSGRVGFGIGLGYSSYNQIVYQKGLFESYSQMDKDGNIYDEWIDSDITYTNKLGYLDVPVMLHLLLGNSKKYYVFVDAGIINQFLVVGAYTMKGSIENMGKYDSGNPYFGLVSQNNSYYDHKIQLYDVKDDKAYKSYNLSGHFSLGIAAPMTDNLFLKVQPYVNVGFSDITGKDMKGQEYENVFGKKSDYQKTKLFAAGLNIGFAINLGQ